MGDPVADTAAAAGLDSEDAKLVVLARASRARAGSAQGAALRDLDGRTYTAGAVALTGLSLSALQVTIAMAVSSGATGCEAAVVVAEEPADDAGSAVLARWAPAAVLRFARTDGSLVEYGRAR